MAEVTTIEFFVPGEPKGAGSKTAQVVRRKGGALVTVPDGRGGMRPLVTVRDDCKNQDWRTTVQVFARQSYTGAPLVGVPIRLSIDFRMPRPKGHYGTGRNAGRLKPDAPTWHLKKFDRTKLTRCIEDALTGILWHDDTLIVDGNVSKRYGETPGAVVRVEVIEEGE